MGWNPFKSKKKTTVSTVVSRVIADNLLPDSLRTGALRSLRDGEQLIEHVIEDMSKSIGLRADRMYHYGKNGYPQGVPMGTLLSSGSGAAVARTVIEQIEGRPVTIEYSQYGALNNLHYGWLTLVNSYGYNQVTNEITSLSALKGYPVYLVDMEVVVTDASYADSTNGSLAQWGTAAQAGPTPDRLAWSQKAATPYRVDPYAAEDYFYVAYSWKVGKHIHTEYLSFPMTQLDPNMGYFQVKYSYGALADGTGSSNATVKYWTYDDGTGVYPALDNVFATQVTTEGGYFPFGYFRYAGQPTSTDPASAEYKSSKKLLKYLDMDYAQLVDGINGNPDIKDVESAVLMMGVSAQTTNPLEIRYLFDYFSDMYVKTGGYGLPQSAAASRAETLLAGLRAPEVSLVIQDTRFKMTVGMNGIFRHKRVGSIGVVGSYTSGYGSEPVTETVMMYNPQTSEYELLPQTTDAHYHYYRKQVTPSIYEEIVVYDLNVSYFVWGNYTSSAGETSPNLLIPIDRDISDRYNPFDKEQLYARSLHYVFNSKFVTKIKWYQQGWFQIVMIIVAIVITILSMGSLAAPMAAAVALGTQAVITFIIMEVILPMVLVKLAAMAVVKVLGAEVAMVIAIVVAVYAVGSSMASGSGGSGVSGAPWAKQLLQVSSSLSSAVSDAFSKALLDVKRDADMFGLYAEEKTKLLEETNKLLEGDNIMSPFVLFGESSTDYYQRTIHSGNIGTLGIAAVSSYVDVALTLPKLSQTLGEDV